MLPAGQLVAANFNLHAGIDGWGRPFDAPAACQDIGADVLVLEETWTPDDPKRGPGLAWRIGQELGLSVVEQSIAHGRRALPHPQADHRWMRPGNWRPGTQALFLDGERMPRRVLVNPRYAEAEPGYWGIAVLSRFPVVGHEVIELPRLRRDPARRAALLVQLDVGGAGHALGGTITVAGTHMAHLSHGSPLHFRRLNRLLEERLGDGPALLAGDMNLWGPPVAALFPGWRRAVRARTWPAWSPHSQVDHILVRGPLEVVDGVALPMAGSDHRPVRATLRLA